MIRAPALLICSTLALSACASSGEYPSLARRDAERIHGNAEVVQPEPPPSPPPAPPSADLEARLSSAVDRARTAHERFAAVRDRAERLISAARGTPMGSENWSVATIALAELESARGDATIALADLDQLYAAERVERFASESTAATAIAAARDRIAVWIKEENDVLAQLRGRLMG